MVHWNQHDLRVGMKVYSANAQPVGHVADIYEDSFLLHKGFFFPKDRYIPYDAIGSLQENELRLTFSETELMERKWEKRPDYEHHLADPTQLMYDRSHDVHDPYDEMGFDQPGT